MESQLYQLALNLTGASRTPEVTWEDCFSVESLREIFEAIRIRDRLKRTAPGIDRISVSQFKKRLDAELDIVQRKCLAGSYTFSPFLRVLILRRADQTPRVISIPTIRDRIVLQAMKRFLDGFLVRMEKPRPRSVIRCVDDVKHLVLEDGESAWCLRGDIQDCFASIPHDALMHFVRALGLTSQCEDLILGLLKTPTLPFGTGRPRPWVVERGIPQGLCISSLLAEIYLSNIDDQITKQGIRLVRYADDMALFHKNANTSMRVFREVLDQFSLTANEAKTRCAPIEAGFSFLGYAFSPGRISISTGSVERLVTEVSAQVARLRHSRPRARNPKEFLYNVNLKITGAVKGKRRYGWLFHYIQMTDLTQLHQVQQTIQKIVSRTGLESELKRLPRAYYEAKYRARGGYILDYDAVLTPQQMRENLRTQGLPDVERLSEPRVAAMFAKLQEEHLQSLMKDAFFTS